MATDVSKVRLLINDVDGENRIFSDDEINVFIEFEGDNLRLAAAQALDAIASNEALVSKRIRTLGLSTDGPAVAKALRDHADRLRAQVADADEGDAIFGVVDACPTYPERAEWPEVCY